jgi:hypothetical protein
VDSSRVASLRGLLSDLSEVVSTPGNRLFDSSTAASGTEFYLGFIKSYGDTIERPSVASFAPWNELSRVSLKSRVEGLLESSPLWHFFQGVFVTILDS